MRNLGRMLRGPALAALILPSVALAAYPERHITLIVPWNAGGSTDLSVRPLASAAEKHLGQPVVLVNKPGANATIGMGELARSQPDGYTIGVYNAATYMAPLTTFTVAYDPIGSFSFISYYGDNLIGVVVRKEAKWESLNDLIEDAKRNPNKISVGVPGASTTEAMMTHGLENRSGAKFISVPFPGVAPVLTALLGGHVDFITATSTWAPNVAKGELRILALNSATRTTSYPSVPTLNELGYPYMRSIATIAGPAGIPEDRRKKLEDAFRLAAKSEPFLKAMEGLRMAVVDMSGDETRRAVEEEYQKARKFLGK
jgi:tripartite-type tricarboxylate transporter receptor subunit TctC